MNKLLIAGKFLDQPRLINNFKRVVPTALVAGAVCQTYVHVNNAPAKEKKKEIIKSVSVWGLTIPMAIMSPKFTPKIIDGCSKLFSHAKSACKKSCEHIHEKHSNQHQHEHGHEFDADEMIELIDDFVLNKTLSPSTKNALEKAKTDVLMPSEIKTVFTELKKDKAGQEFLRKFVPDPENIDSNHIFEEIGRLSLMGAFTVSGGILGGILGDKLTNENLKDTVPNKIKEGAYQFLANIFLCNVGAGAALVLMEGAAGKLDRYKKKGVPESGLSKLHYNLLEKLNPQSKITRAVTMTGGIILAGIVFGSVAANAIGKMIIDPLLGNSSKSLNKNKNDNIYSERTPEMLDIGLHVDDIATVAVLSGLKWIEPALPILYSISGYRAGIGYRNGDK